MNDEPASADSVGRVQIGVCTFEFDRQARFCRTIFPDGLEARVDVPREQSRRSLAKRRAWGYRRGQEGVLSGVIEHEALHTWVPVTLWGLPWSPELRSTSLGHPEQILPALRPWPGYRVSYEEGVVIALTLWIKRGWRKRGWRDNPSWSGQDPLEVVPALEHFAGRARDFLDALGAQPLQPYRRR